MKTESYIYLKFLTAPLLFGFLSWINLKHTDIYSFVPFGVIFIIVPILDAILPAEDYSLPKDYQENSIFFRWIILLIVPLQLGILCAFLITYHTHHHEVSLLTKIGWISSMGIACGVLGINVGHELGHRSSKWERMAGKLLLLTSLRMSFFLEHNLGHHKHVATPKDPATAKVNQNVYHFILQSLTLSWLNAWKLQLMLMKRKKLHWLSIKNDMFWFMILQLFSIGLIGYIFDLSTSIAFISSALIGILLLEIVNYLQHYGLSRRLLDNGKYERTTPLHSWDSTHSFSSVVLFNLTKHADHHFKASKPYYLLEDHNSSPKLPYGYAAMILLSTIPPLFFKIMNRKIHQFKQEYH